MLPQNSLQGSGIKQSVLWNLIDDVGKVCEEVSLVLVREDGWDTSIIELNGFVMYSDEVNSRMGGDEGCKSV
jgi:hypothetical protein